MLKDEEEVKDDDEEEEEEEEDEEEEEEEEEVEDEGIGAGDKRVSNHLPPSFPPSLLPSLPNDSDGLTESSIHLHFVKPGNVTYK